MYYVFGGIIFFLSCVILVLLYFVYKERRQNVILAEELIEAKGRNVSYESESKNAGQPFVQVASDNKKPKSIIGEDFHQKNKNSLYERSRHLGSQTSSP